ncbi:MAG: hypothetical protein ACK5NG_00860 [Chthoniobacterales bacterium]
MNWLLIAGGMALSSLTTQVEKTDTTNYTLLAERVPSEEVLTRSYWGTPMLPDGKGGYSMISPINPEYIARSLKRPPITNGKVFRPSRATAQVINAAQEEALSLPTN